MKHPFLPLLVLSLVCTTATAEQDKFAPLSYEPAIKISVRGSLVWTSEKQTITECETGRVYQVRILAANPHFRLARQVEELAANGAESIIAELRGGVSTDWVSSPGYEIDGVFYVSEIVSVGGGGCNDE